MSGHRLSYDVVANSYEFASHIYSTGRIKAAKLSQINWLKPASKIIYLGCGSGDDVIEAARAGHQVTAIDLSQNMLDRLDQKQKKMDLDIRLVNSNVLEFGELGQYDYVAANFFFNIFDNASLQPILQQAIDLLHPHGELLVADVALPTGSLPAKLLNWSYINSAQLSFSLLGLVKLHKNHDYQKMLESMGWKLTRNEFFRILKVGPIMFQSMMFSRKTKQELVGH